MDSYKNTKEWIALDNIWKSISRELKEQNREHFKIVAEMIKERYAVVDTEIEVDSLEDDYRYLNEVSPEAKQLVIDLVNDGDKNLYHSIMAVIETHRGEFTSINQLWQYYSKRFGKERSYIYRYEDEIREIIELCLIRMDRKGINPL